MKYNNEQQLEIGRQIYDGEITPRQAEDKYGISHCSTTTYRQKYEKEFGLPPRNRIKACKNGSTAILASCEPRAIEDYESMSKNELIDELVKSRIREARLKKGYEVKGDGSVIHYDNKNIR
jgi:transposase